MKSTIPIKAIDIRLPSPPVQELQGRSLARIEELNVAVIDNGKGRQQFGNFEAAFREVTTRLEDHGARVSRHVLDLLHLGESDIRDRAKTFESFDASVIGVADTGVSAPTALLAVALDALGLRVVILSQGIGTTTITGMLDQLGRQIPTVELQSWRLSSAEEVIEEMEILWPRIDEGLRAAPSTSGVADSPRHSLPHLSLNGPDLTSEFTERMAIDGFGDGLPLIAPTLPRVSQMMDAMGVTNDETVWDPIGSRSTPVTGSQVAALAVMAGCHERAASIVIEAFRCMQEPGFRLFQAAITTHPAGTLVLVSGPAADKAGMTASFGSLGPLVATNAAIGRAIALSYGFLLGMRPGHGDISLQGSPAEFTYCVAENTTDSPWQSQSQDLFGDKSSSSVTVLKCEGPHNILDNVSTTPEGLLKSIADTASSLGGNNLYVHGAQTVVFLNPEHARIIADAGWQKSDAQAFLFETARRKRDQLVGRGIVPNWDYDVADQVPIARKASDIVIVVVGAPGPQSQVAIPWGYSRGATRLLKPPLPTDSKPPWIS